MADLESRSPTTGELLGTVPVAGAVDVRDAVRLASQPARLRSARWLPYDPALVRARTGAARVLHGRESERLAALRDGALPAARLTFRSLRRHGR